MESATELNSEFAATPAVRAASIQGGCYLLELSLDWIVLGASENIHHLLGKSHVTLIDEPLGRFVKAQPLHDIRNLFSRLSGTTGIGRAYGIRLTDEPDLVDLAFQLADGRVVLEAVPAVSAFGEHFGTVGGLIGGLADYQGQALLDGGARRMRALTGYDRVTVLSGHGRSESARGSFAGAAPIATDLPPILADAKAEAIAVFPRSTDGSAASKALLRAAAGSELEALLACGIRSSLRIPFSSDGVSGEFRCECRTACKPSFELHAAAELFAQLFAMRLQIDQLTSR
jgi:light-regulated signal transduction histidine kinase (bacteriophytochrome)